METDNIESLESFFAGHNGFSKQQFHKFNLKCFLLSGKFQCERRYEKGFILKYLAN